MTSALANLAAIPSAAAERFRRRCFELEDRLFERAAGLDFGGVIGAADLDLDDAARVHATSYQAVWCRNLRVLLRESRRMAGSPLRTFVDIGSGKGKACFYASRYGDFQKILGVEYSETLVAAAEANLRKSGRRDIQFIHADATRFDLPESPSFVFLFNPFDDLMMEQFLSRNLDHFRKHGSHLAYANDIESETVTRMGFEAIFREDQRKIALYRAVEGK